MYAQREAELSGQTFGIAMWHVVADILTVTSTLRPHASLGLRRKRRGGKKGGREKGGREKGGREKKRGEREEWREEGDAAAV